MNNISQYIHIFIIVKKIEIVAIGKIVEIFKKEHIQHIKKFNFCFLCRKLSSFENKI